MCFPPVFQLVHIRAAKVGKTFVRVESFFFLKGRKRERVRHRHISANV